MTMIKRLSFLGLTAVFCLSLSGCLSMIKHPPRAATAPAASTSSSISGHKGTAAERAKALTNLGASLLAAGEPHKALPELLEARKLDPKNADLENYIGQAYYGMKEYDLAVESYGRALELSPQRTDIRNNRGLAYLDQKKYDLALAEFNLCLKDLVYQSKEKPMCNMGLAYMAMGEYDQAMSILRRATEVAPNYAKSYQLIGLVHLAEGRTKEAVDYLHNAVKLDPGNSETLMALGDAQARLGQREEAAQSYSRASALAPNTPLALEAQKRARQVMGFD